MIFKCQIYYKCHHQISMSSQLYTSLIILSIVTVFYFVWLKPRRAMKTYAKLLRDRGFTVLQLPYNPLKNQMIETIKKGIEAGDALKLYKQDYGNYDVIVSNILITPKLQFNHPDFIKDFYTVDKHYEYPKQQKITNIFARAAGHGLPFSESQTWKRKRTVLNKVFNFDFVKSQSNKIAQTCDQAIKEFENDGKKIEGQNAVSYNILDLTVRMFSGVMMQSFLGGTQYEMINEIPAGKFLKKLVSDLSQQSFYPINFLLGTKFLSLGLTQEQRDIEKRIQIYRKWGIEFIRKRMAEINAKLNFNAQNKIAADIIEALMIANRKSKAENNLEEQISSEQEIFEEFNAFFVAGTDTTSNFTQMMIYSIAKYPQVEAKVRAEIKEFMQHEDYGYENLKNLKYIDLLQKQTTRCFGPGTHLFTRKAKADNYLNGLPIKKGTNISIMVMGNHFSEKYFKNPKQFRPERWESQCNNISPYVFGGFSGGARTCIGKHLAMLQSKIALVKFMKRYNKIILGKEDYKMVFKFLYSPEDFDTKMIINQ